MIWPSHIFCEPDFAEVLREALPGQQIHIFSYDVSSVQDDITHLNIDSSQPVWLLMGPAEPFKANALVKDHMNLCRENPLIGPARGDWPRFPDMSSVYVDSHGVVAVLGEDKDLVDFNESWISVCGGIWEAIVLSQHGIKCKAWVISDLEKWVKELPAFD